VTRWLQQRREWSSSLLGLVVALLVGLLAARAFGYAALDGYRALGRYSFGSWSKTGITLSNAVPLLLTGLSAAIAFGSGPVNLGQPGQVLMGALFATVGGLSISLPSALQIPLLLALSFLGGAFWAGIAAVFKRRFGMDEFIVTLMLNEIARLFTDWVIGSPLRDKTAGSVTTKAIHSTGFLPKLGVFNVSVLVGSVMLVVSIVVVQHLVVGYEWRMAGKAPLFARLGGVDVDGNFTRVMWFTGGLAGMAGGVLLMSGSHRFLKGLGGNFGWDGVMIAVVAVNALLAVLLYALVFSALQTGAIGMEIRADIPQEFIQILEAMIVLVTVAARGAVEATLLRIASHRTVSRTDGGSKVQTVGDHPPG
jgi:general nucleoside transport system permease protein